MIALLSKIVFGFVAFIVMGVLINDFKIMLKFHHCWLRGRRHQWMVEKKRPAYDWERCMVCGWTHARWTKG